MKKAKEILVPSVTISSGSKEIQQPRKIARSSSSILPTKSLKRVVSSFLDPGIELEPISRIQWQIEAFFIERELIVPVWTLFPPPDPLFEDECELLAQHNAGIPIKELEIKKQDKKNTRLLEINKIDQPYERRRASVMYSDLSPSATSVGTSISKKSFLNPWHALRRSTLMKSVRRSRENRKKKNAEIAKIQVQKNINI